MECDLTAIGHRDEYLAALFLGRLFMRPRLKQLTFLKQRDIAPASRKVFIAPARR